MPILGNRKFQPFFKKIIRQRGKKFNISVSRTTLSTQKKIKLPEKKSFLNVSLRDQTEHSLHFKRNPYRPKSDLSRNPQHCYFSLISYAVLDFTNKSLNHCTAQNRSNYR